MKKIFLITVLVPFIGLSQKIKTKKDKVLIDDVEIAVLNDAIRDQYELSDLEGNKKFTVEYKSLMDGQIIINQWLAVANADGSKKTEIPYDVLITSFSPTKIILHLLSVKYNLFNVDGFDDAKITEFFATQRESISDKSLKAKVSGIEDRKVKDAKIGSFKPFVKKDKTIVSGGYSGTNIIGRINASTYTAFGNNNNVQVIDLDGVMVANANITGNANNDVNVELFNGTKFTYQSTKRYSGQDDDIFLTDLVGELVFRDFYLGHQAKAYNQKTLDAKVKLAKERSANIYNLPGYVIDDKGVKYEGSILAQFEMLDINQTGNNQVVDAIDNYGKNVTVKYLNENGKERSKTLYARDNIKFYVNNADGTKTCFEGMMVKGDAAKKLSNAMSLGFNNAYFYRTIYSENDNTLLVDPVEKERFVIKLKANEKGQMIDKRNNTNLSVQLAEYLASCKKLSDEVKKEAFDLKIEENLINIIKEFNDCK